MKKSINILMVGSDLSVKGGMTSVVKAFLKNKYNKDLFLKFVPTHIEGVSAIKKIIFFIKSLLIIRREFAKNTTIVHIHMSEKGSFYRKSIVAFFARIHHVKTIIHMHGAEFKEFYNNSNKFVKNRIKNMLVKADVVIVLGDSWNKLVKRLDNRINTMIFRNSIECQTSTANYNGKDVAILFLAVLIKRKGIMDLVKICKLIDNDTELQNYNIKFIIAGSGKDEIEMKNMIGSYNLNKYFEFKGWIDDLEKKTLLEESQLFILPSYNEGLPVGILEGMSYGLPIITTNVGSIEDAVKDDYNGYVLNPGDIGGFYICLKKIIVNKNMWSEFSANSKKIIESKYNSNEYFKEMQELYYKIVK